MFGSMSEHACITQLPLDILLAIAEFMSYPDFAVFIRTCSAFHEITTYEDIWRFFFVRQLEAEKRALLCRNNHKSRAQLQRIEKNLKRHTDYEHRRFIQGTEFLRVLKFYNYTGIIDDIYARGKKLEQTVDEYYDFMTYVNRVFNVFIPDETQSRKRIFEKMTIEFQQNMYFMSDSEDPIAQEKFLTCARILHDSGVPLHDYCLMKLVRNSPLLKKLLESISPKPVHYHHTIFQILCEDKLDNTNQMTNAQILEYLYPKYITQEMLYTFLGARWVQGPYNGCLEVMTKAEDISGYRICFDVDQAWAVYQCTRDHVTDVSAFVEWMQGRFLDDELLAPLFCGLVHNVTANPDAFEENVTHMEDLVQRGVDINGTYDYIDCSPYVITRVLDRSNFMLIKWLINHGADIEINEQALSNSLVYELGIKSIEKLQFLHEHATKKGLRYYINLIIDYTSFIELAKQYFTRGDYADAYLWLNEHGYI
jgi:hypothetical protein